MHDDKSQLSKLLKDKDNLKIYKLAAPSSSIFQFIRLRNTIMVVPKKGHDDLLPPGFRFHPTDEELIMHYLKNQATSQPCPASIIPQVDIYKFDPWQLPDQALFGEKEWYFFTPRDRKYPNGARPNRAAVSGYWKATGTDKAIYSGSKYVGVKKALVFYKGRPPKGTKTDWIMHEYRLIDHNAHGSTPKMLNKSMRLDDWVLCRIYKKKKASFCMERTSLVHDEQMIKVEGLSGNIIQTVLPYNDNNNIDVLELDPAPAPATGTEDMVFPRVCSISHMLDWELDNCFGILNENNVDQCCSASSSSSVFDSIINNGGGTQWNIEPANQKYYAMSMSLRPPQENSQTSELFGFH